MALVMIDAGHGGSDPGAVYNGRQEKDDTLKIAMAVGDILSQNGVDVRYTRMDDRYETPFQKAMEGNQAGADYFLSIHRNASDIPGQYNGIQTLVYRNDGERRELAQNINQELTKLGFRDAGIVERPNLVVLKRTQMPAALVEVGFIDSDADNRILDQQFEGVARAIANGVLQTINPDMEQSVMMQIEQMNQYGEMDTPKAMENWEMMEDNKKLYRVQVGAYRNRENAERILNDLLAQGFPAYMIYDEGLYLVQVGAYELAP